MVQTCLFNANEVHANGKVADGTIVAGTAAKPTLTGNNIWSATMWPPEFSELLMETSLQNYTLTSLIQMAL